MPHPNVRVLPSRAPGNALRHAFHDVSRWRVAWNVVCLGLAKKAPWFSLKNGLLKMAGVKVGRNAAVALDVELDVLFPGQITIGADSVVGFRTTILCHGYLVETYQLGPVAIGARVAIGANTTILPGVTIGDGATIGAMSLVNRDIPAGEFWAGVPARKVR